MSDGSKRAAGGLSLTGQSVRTRPATPVLLVLISAAAVLTAVLGPLLARAVHLSALADALAAAGPAGTSITVRGTIDVNGSPASAVQAVLLAGRDAAPELWQDPQTFMTTSAGAGWTPAAHPLPGGRTVASRVTAADQPCQGLVVERGECPAASGEVLISTEDAGRHRVGIGSDLVVTTPDRPPLRLKITGLYDAERSDQARLLRPGTSAGQLAQVTGDSLVTTVDQTATINLPFRLTGRLLLRPDATVGLAQEPVLRASLDAVTRELAAQSVVLEYDTGLPTLLDTVDTQAGSSDVLVAVTAVQALALVIFTLAIVVQRTAHARTAEWSLGRLRGVPRLRWLTAVYTEPTAALVVGVPIGLAAGVTVAAAVAARELRPGTVVEPWRAPVLVAAAVALVAALVALLATTARTLRRPLVDALQQNTESRRWTVPAAMAQTAVVLLALLSGYQLVTGTGLGGGLGSGRFPLGLVAPAAFALAVGAVGVRLAVVAVGRLTDRPARSRAALVVGRRAARVPSSLNPAVVLAVGVAVALFASQTWLLSTRNQDRAAAAVVGAGTVLTVDVPRGTDLIEAVRRADPEGRFALAAEERTGSSTGGTARIVAVDSERLAAVAAWSPAWSGVADLTTALRGSPTTPIEIRGRRVTLHLADVRVSVKAGVSPGSGQVVDLAPGELAPPDLGLVVDDGVAWTRVSFGPLGAGTTLTADLPCRTSCRLVGLSLQSTVGSSYEASFVVTGIGTDTTSDSTSVGWLRDPTGWRERVADQTSPQPPAGLTPAVDPRGLSVKAFDTEGGNPTTAARTDTVDPLPAVVGPAVQIVTVSGLPDVAYGTGLNGLSELIRVVGRASVLPRSLDDGVLVDLRNARGLTDPAESEAVSEVWLAEDAPPGIRTALVREGLQVRGTEEIETVRTELTASATTRGAAAARWIGYAALVLGVIGLIAARVADAGRRRADWRSLRDAGLAGATVRRLVVVEVAVPAALGVLVGTGAGLLALVLAAPRLPLVDPGRPGPPLDLTPAWGAVALVTAGALGCVAVVAAAAALVEGRDREGPS